MEGAAAGSLREDEVKADGRRGAWKGANEKNDTEIWEREMRGQLQQASPAAASNYGLAEGDKMAAETAADGEAAKGRLGMQDAGNAAPLRGAKQLQEPATAAEQKVTDGDKGERLNKSTASHRDVADTEMWRQVRDGDGDGGKSDVGMGKLQAAAGCRLLVTKGSRSGRVEVASAVAAAALQQHRK